MLKYKIENGAKHTPECEPYEMMHAGKLLENINSHTCPIIIINTAFGVGVVIVLCELILFNISNFFFSRTIKRKEQTVTLPDLLGISLQKCSCIADVKPNRQTNFNYNVYTNSPNRFTVIIGIREHLDSENHSRNMKDHRMIVRFP